ncbi:hypothetical protein Pfo_004736 [Paulownia fortunei]|nr:hypothetical protein Pfo_004736 [Paulownia fortunei]
MRNTEVNEDPTSPERNNLRRRKFGALLSSDPANLDNNYDDFNYDHPSSRRNSISSISSSQSSAIYDSNIPSSNSSSPWSQPSPYMKSPWAHQAPESSPPSTKTMNRIRISSPNTALLGPFFGKKATFIRLRLPGICCTLALKARIGLVKAIVVLGDKIFTGHQDGKIRVWTLSGDKRNTYNRIGSLPKTQDLLMKSMNPKNYVEVRRKRSVPWIKHYDAVSCMSIDADQGLLYSGSWDKTMKVWRISDSKCLESIQAHDDALNSVVVAFGGLVFTGSADGTVKAWRLELVGKRTKHVLVETLLKHEHALTSLAVSHAAGAVYAGSSDGLVRFWEREKRFMTYGGVLRGHKQAVLCLAAGGNLVLSGSADKSICVWRRDVGGVHACVAVLRGHEGPVKCIAVEKDTSTAEEDECEKRWIVYSGSLDKSVKIWRVSEHGPSLKELQQE